MKILHSPPGPEVGADVSAVVAAVEGDVAALVAAVVAEVPLVPDVVPGVDPMLSWMAVRTGQAPPPQTFLVGVGGVCAEVGYFRRICVTLFEAGEWGVRLKQEKCEIRCSRQMHVCS